MLPLVKNPRVLNYTKHITAQWIQKDGLNKREIKDLCVWNFHVKKELKIKCGGVINTPWENVTTFIYPAMSRVVCGADN